MNVDTEHLVLSIAEAILDPSVGTTSYRVLEYAIDMAKVPAPEKCNMFQVVGDMLKDEVMRVTIALRKLEKKHEQVRATLKKEQANSRALSNQVCGLTELIKGKETGDSNPQRYVIEQLQKEVVSLKCKVSIPASPHVKTAELAQVEK